MRIYTLNRTTIPKVAALATGLAAAVMLATVTINPQAAQAFPRAASCSGCHGAATAGTTTATPSSATLAPGAAYTVAIALVANAAGGNSGYSIVPVTAGSGTTFGGNTGPLLAYTASMTAPAAAGTYSYTVWTSQGPTDGTGRVGSVVYTITVGAVATTPPVTTPPVTTPPVTTPPVTTPIRVDEDSLSPTSALGESHLSMYNLKGANCATCHDGSFVPTPPSITGEDLDMEPGVSCRTCHKAGGEEDALFISLMNNPTKVVYDRCSNCHTVVSDRDDRDDWDD